MSSQAFQFLTAIEPFASLPKNDLQQIANVVTVEQFDQGSVLFNQGKTVLDYVYVIKEGALELFFESQGKKKLIGYQNPGEIFGGISILMNSGISAQTVQVANSVSCYLIPKRTFLDVCSRYNFFYQHFVDAFAKLMMNESYASVIAANQAFQFLASIEPFSFLPQEEIERISAIVSIKQYPKGTILAIQGQTRLDHLYIIQKGAAERYFEEGDKQTLKGVISDGDIFGGISILLNDGIVVRTLRLIEDTFFYALPRRDFIDICQRFESFSEFFTDTFGKRMLDRTYATIIAKTVQTQGESSQFFNSYVENIYTKDPVYCDEDISICDAANVMTRHNCSSILIRQKTGEFIGIVTDNDLRKKVIAKEADIHQPVHTIMSTPLARIPAQSLVFEAMMTMMRTNYKHLAVSDAQDKIVGVITYHDLLKAQGHSPFFLIREINAALSKEELLDKHGRLPQIIQNMIHTGAKAQNITRLITTVSDSILEKLINFAIQELGPPPGKFVFMILGSEGRKEQTLKTDQDNAIIYEDPPEGQADAVRKYFLELGDVVCTWLDEAGYAYCKGDIMAKNPKWCQPFSIWKEYFSSWIFTGKPEALLHSSIFFDFRGAYGDMELIEKLRRFLFGSLEGWAGFYRNLTENALHFKPPLGFFRNFVVESKGEHRNALDLKGAMQPIIDFARIYALRSKIEETNTLERLKQIFIKKVISRQEFNELEHSYSFLMQLRFVRQVTAVTEENGSPDNYINPKKLSRIEQTMMKEIFKRIEKFQSKLSFDFTGLT